MLGRGRRVGAGLTHELPGPHFGRTSFPTRAAPMTEIDDLVDRRRRHHQGFEAPLDGRDEVPSRFGPVSVCHTGAVALDQPERDESSEHRIEPGQSGVGGFGWLDTHDVNPVVGSARSLTSDSSRVDALCTPFYHRSSRVWPRADLPSRAIDWRPAYPRPRTLRPRTRRPRARARRRPGWRRGWPRCSGERRAHRLLRRGERSPTTPCSRW